MEDNFSWPHNHKNEIVPVVNVSPKLRILALESYLYLHVLILAFSINYEILKFIRADRNSHTVESVIIATFSSKIGLLLALKLCLYLHMLFLPFSTNYRILVLKFITAEKWMFTHYCISAVINWALLQAMIQMLGTDAVCWFLFLLSPVEKIGLFYRTCRSSFWAWNRINCSTWT